MADIPVEKKSGGGWWKWILGLLLAALVVWLLIALFDADEPDIAEDPAIEEPVATPEPRGEASGVTLGSILGAPNEYVDEPFPEVEVTVSSVPTDRGFWIVEEMDSLFAVIIDQPEEQPKDINPGQRLQVTDGTLRDATFLPDIPGAPLDETTRNIAEEQELFLVVDEGNIEVLEAGSPQPGTDPAGAFQSGAGGS